MDDSHKFKIEKVQTKSNELKIPYYYYTEEQASTESSDDSFLDVPIDEINDDETDKESDDNDNDDKVGLNYEEEDEMSEKNPTEDSKKTRRRLVYVKGTLKNGKF